MATATRSSSTSSSRALNGASRSTKRSTRSAQSKSQQLTQYLSRESAALAKRAGNLYSSTRTSARNHPVAAVGVVAGIAALIGGAFYALRNR